MPTKVKGILKGFKKISQIFDEEEDEMQIGLPTDVKHVAHIGQDGPVEAPSWMKDFKSAPLAPPEENSRQDPEIVWVSEDSKRSSRAAKDLPEVPKPTQSKKDPSAKTKQSRRHRTRQEKESSEPGSSLPAIPRRSHRKKSKESEAGGGSTRSRSRATAPTATAYESPFSDPGPDMGPIVLPEDDDDRDVEAKKATGKGDE